MRAAEQQAVALHLTLNLAPLHLGGSLKALGHGLGAEALLIDALHSFACILVVHEHQRGTSREEAQQRLFLVDAIHLGHYVDAPATVARQLVVNLERAYGVNLIAKEVDAVGIFVAEAVDVEDASAQGELPRLVDIVDLAEAQRA